MGDKGEILSKKERNFDLRIVGNILVFFLNQKQVNPSDY